MEQQEPRKYVDFEALKQYDELLKKYIKYSAAQLELNWEPLGQQNNKDENNKEG